MPRRHSKGIRLISVKSPEEAAAFIVEDYKNSNFLTAFGGFAWLRKRIKKELEERDELITQDVGEALGGSCSE